MKREESVDRSLDEIALDIQWNLRKLSAALDRYYGHEPQREIGGYTEPASKANFDPAQPRDDQGQWTRAGGKSGMHIDRAVDHLNDNALPASNEDCAIYVRQAIQAGGVQLKRPFPEFAKDYGPYLEKHNFEKLTPTPSPMYKPQKGDIAVFQAPPDQDPPMGHIQMYNGEQWVSDFKQPKRTDGLWPGRSYRKFKPPYEVYRP
ncbi:MAG: hypothetical protein HY579_04475 [Nitrospinae bacterium]|nr:hypothetical protein [Nitrospinota bacterium]